MENTEHKNEFENIKQIAKGLDISERLKLARRVRNLTQKEIAEEIGISHQSVSRVERATPDNIFVQYLFWLRQQGVDLNFIFDEQK